MKPHLSLVELVGVLAVGLAVALLSPAPCARAQGPQAQDKQQAEVEPLLKEILSVTHSDGEEGLRAWMKANKDRVAADWIVRLADRGVEERDETRIKAALVLATEKGDTSCLARVYGEAGDYRYLLSDYTPAMRFYESALSVYVDIGDLSGQGTVYQREGDVYRMTGEHAKALAAYEKALVSYEKAQNTRGQGNVYLREGEFYRMISENVKALAMYEEALPFYEKVEDPLGQGTVYRSEGDVYFNWGENTKALELYGKALPFYEKAQSLVGQGNVYQREGDVYLIAGEHAKALAMYGEALPYYEKAQDILGEGTVYDCEGDVYRSTGERAKALAMYEKALVFYEEAQSPLGQGNVYQSEGDVYRSAGERAKALAMYERALPFFDKAQNNLGQGNVYRSEGDVYFNWGENTKALELYRKALPFYEKAQEPLGQGNVYQSEGDLYRSKGEQAKALALYVRALEFYGKAGDPQALSRAFFGKARALAAMGNSAAAAPLFEEALSLLERVRTQTGFSELKKSFMTSVYSEYEEAALFMLENQQSEKAFRIAESMKARTFLDSLAEGQAKLDEGLSAELREKRDGLVGRLSALTKQLQEAAGKGDEEKLKALKAQIKSIEDELEKVQMEIRLKNPRYAEVRYPQPIVAAELRAKILEPGEVLVEYLLAKDAAYAFVITRDTFKAVKLPATPNAIGEAVAAYLHWASSATTRAGPEALEEGPMPSAEQGLQLYQWLLKPLEADLPAEATLIIVPDGELAKLPFEALVISLDPSSKKPVYLLEKRRVKYVQSASVLAILRTEYKQEGTSDAFIGFGDPVYDYQHFIAKQPETEGAPRGGDFTAELNRDRYDREGGGFARLPGTGVEVEEIGQLFAASSRKVDLRVAASEENAKSAEMAGYGYIHFACHGILGAGFQSLVLSQIPDSKEDGYFTLGEIMACHYRARLVVLSACKTGTGAVEKGEGVTGLTRAVMYAGTPATVVSLWSVSDVGTKELMVRFYRKLLQEKLSKDGALRSAKLEMLASAEYASPFYWAPFVMYGE